MKLRKKPSYYLLAYGLLVPAIVFFCVFSFVPFIRSISFSMSITDMFGNPKKWVGLQNYIRLMKKPEFWRMIKITFEFAGLVGVGTFITAMFFGMLSMEQRKGSKIYQVMFAIPMAIASVPASSVFIFLLSSNGIINRFLGIHVDWFSNANTALLGVAMVTIWSHTGSSFLYLLVGFRNVPTELNESALIDGANWFTRMFKVTIPIASPQIFFVVFLNILNSFKAFSFFKLLTGTGVGGSTDVVIYEVYKQAFIHNRYETSYVYATILFIIIFLFTRIQFAVEKKVVFYQ